MNIRKQNVRRGLLVSNLTIWYTYLQSIIVLNHDDLLHVTYDIHIHVVLKFAIWSMVMQEIRLDLTFRRHDI